MVLPLLAFLTAAPEAQAVVTIHRSAVAKAGAWDPAHNPRQRVVLRTEGDRRILIRLTEYE